MQTTNRSFLRPVDLAAVVAVIAIPIALMVATWQPLEPLPRTGRANPASQEGPREAAGTPDDGSREKSRRDSEATPAAATPEG